MGTERESYSCRHKKEKKRLGGLRSSETEMAMRDYVAKREKNSPNLLPNDLQPNKKCWRMQK